MRFSDDFINRVREANNIVDLISQYTELKPSGRNLMGLCPFPNHREKTASFSVSVDKQVYHCFGCSKSGGITQFLQEVRGMSFPEAIEFLAERASIPLPKDENISSEQDKAREYRKLLFKLNRLAGSYFRQNLLSLPKSHPVNEYMLKRGLTEEISEEFKIGYASAEWEGLTQLLKSKNAPLHEADSLGLVRRRKDTGQTGYFDLFRERLMFPILNPNQEVIGFGGRILGDGQPKYLNSPESPVFHKGSSLYGLHTTAKYIRADDSVIIVEGYMDLIALYANGIKNVVATLGTALTPEHAKLITKYTKNVIVLFDGDGAGKAAARRSLPILLAEGLSPRGLILENKMDPDDAVKHYGFEKFSEMLSRAPDLFTIQIEEQLRDSHGQASDKVRIFEEMALVLNQMKDARLKSLYSSQIQEALQVDARWFQLAWADFQKKLAAKTQVQRAPVLNEGVGGTDDTPAKTLKTEEIQRSKLSLKKARPEELLLINLALFKEEWLKQIMSSQEVIALRQNPGQLSDVDVAEIFEIIEEIYRHDNSAFARLSVRLNEQVDDTSAIMRYLSKEFEGMANASGDVLVRDVLDTMKNHQLRLQARSLKSAISRGQDQEKLEQFMNVQRERRSLK